MTRGMGREALAAHWHAIGPQSIDIQALYAGIATVRRGLKGSRRAT
jgi:hypothetical protein